MRMYKLWNIWECKNYDIKIFEPEVYGIFEFKLFVQKCMKFSNSRFVYTKLCYFNENAWKSSKNNIKREDIIAAGARFFFTQKCVVFMKSHENKQKTI